MFKKLLDISVSKLSKFISSEVRLEWFHQYRILQSEPEVSITKGDVLGPLKAIGRLNSGGLILRANGIYFSRFRAGDLVDVGCIDVATKKFKKISGTTINLVRFPEPGVLEVIVPGKSIAEDGTELFLLPQSVSGIKTTLQRKLDQLESTNTVAEHFSINHASVRNKFKSIDLPPKN